MLSQGRIATRRPPYAPDASRSNNTDIARIPKSDINEVKAVENLRQANDEILAADATTGQRQFKFIKRPIFENRIRADEINLSAPKTQAALLEAMQKRKISAGSPHVYGSMTGIVEFLLFDRAGNGSSDRITRFFDRRLRWGGGRKMP